MAWFGDPKGHAKAGRKGGKAQGKKNNPGNFANDREKAKRAGAKGGGAIGNKRNKAMSSTAVKNKKL